MDVFACVLLGTLLSATPPPVRLVAIGDVMLGRGVAPYAARHGNPLQSIAPLLRNAHVSFANLECTLSDRGQRKRGGFALRGDPVAALWLERAGLDVVSLANNHTSDFGPLGVDDTLDAVRAAGVHAVGVSHAGEPALELLEVHGVRVAFLAFNEIEAVLPAAGTLGPTPLQLDAAQRAVVRARENVDVVVVSLHWGYQYQHAPTRHMRRVAHALVDAGAQVILGHHPHVMQGVERRGRAIIAYSLGNAVFDQKDPNTHVGLALEVTLDATGPTAARLRILDTHTPSPTLLTGRAARRHLRQVRAWSARLGDAPSWDGPDALRLAVPPPPPQPALALAR